MASERDGLHSGEPEEQGSPNKTNGSLSSQKDGSSIDSEATDVRDLPQRDQWSNKLDFLLSCVGFAVGLGNVWRFPYLCYKNGGGAFLIPYFICLICGGAPVFFLEIALGQFMSQGGLGVWKICPLFQGIGWSTTVITFLLNIYYIVILAWNLYYLFMSFTSVLPWSHCNNDWNTDRCTVSFRKPINCSNATLPMGSNATTALYGLSNFTDCGNNNMVAKNFTPVDPVVEFWENKILQISGGVDQPNGIVWQLAVALLIVWMMCYFCIWKGVKWTGKVVYFTATFPYIVLTVLLIRGVTLDGAKEGIIFYLKPDFSRLGDAQVWIDAGTQIFFSYAIALGAMTALGSYNKFKNNCYTDCILIASINSFTSVFAGFVIFSVLGFMAKEQGVSIQSVAESGPGLVFIVYPKAVTQMPVAPLWAILFFVMIMMLGLGSQFVGMEAFVTAVSDIFPTFLSRGYNKEIFIAVYSGVSYLIGLTMVTRGGMYVFQIFDYYSASGMTLLWVCFCECIAVSWAYGKAGGRFYDNIEMMIGFRINPWLRICWTVITPLLTAGIFIFSLVQFQVLTYNKTYAYPGWAQAIGMCMSFLAMMCIPLGAVVKLLTTPGSLKERWKVATTAVLRPHQIPSHWPEANKIKLFEKEKQPFITGPVVEITNYMTKV